MLRHPVARWSSYLLAALFLFVLPVAAQVTAQTPEPTAVPILNEPHHHLVVGNSYVHALWVEILPHDSTLRHQHDLPFVGINASPAGFRVSFTLGGYAHAVSNTGDTPIHNFTIELVRPQGAARNRCAEAVRGQPTEDCHPAALTAAAPSSHSPLLESDEILVEDWEFAPGAAVEPPDDRRDMLVAGLSGVTITGRGGIDSTSASHGMLWIPAGSKPVFKTAPDAGGRFITITFKDSAASSSRPN